MMQLLPDAGLLPVPQPPPAGHADELVKGAGKLQVRG
jgi:hypothetical protein